MKISRLSPRYEDELLEHARAIEDIVPWVSDLEWRKKLFEIAQDLRFMVTDNDRFLNS